MSWNKRYTKIKDLEEWLIKAEKVNQLLNSLWDAYNRSICSELSLNNNKPNTFSFNIAKKYGFRLPKKYFDYMLELSTAYDSKLFYIKPPPSYMSNKKFEYIQYDDGTPIDGMSFFNEQKIALESDMSKNNCQKSLELAMSADPASYCCAMMDFYISYVLYLVNTNLCC